MTIPLPASGRALAVFGPNPPRGIAAGEIALEGVPIRCGFVEVPAPAFDPAAMPRAVLLRKRGFSFNFRDRALALTTALRAEPGRYAPLGSDFVAEVLACGAAVTEFAPGDRVIGNAAYPESGEAGVRPGVPTNAASREYQVLPAVKLMRIPEVMTDAVAAGFSIGGQTATSMVRRIAPSPGGVVLVTAGRSNTSLFAIAALRARGVEIHATTGSDRDHDRLRALGVTEVLVMRSEAGRPVRFATHSAARRILAERGGYDAVIDPFADLHLQAAVEVLRIGGTYITCGLQDQHSNLVKTGPGPALQGSAVITALMLKNLTVLGNCIGTAEDLSDAVAAHAAGRLPVLVDSVHTDTADAAGFLHRTWLAPDRLGKVVFLYG